MFHHSKQNAWKKYNLEDTPQESLQMVIIWQLIILYPFILLYYADVQDFLKQYSNDYKKQISMWENYKSLSKAYQNVCQTLYLNVVTLKDNVQKYSNKKFTSKHEEGKHFEY